MEFFPDSRIIFSVGPITITWYATMIIAGALLAYYISVKNFEKYNVSKSLLSDCFMNIFIIGIIGARIWYVIFMYKDLYANRPFIDMFKIYEGGLAIQGGLVFGVIYGIYFFRKHKINILVAGDCIMPNVLIAQSIGRWGNFFNQEAHGGEVSRAFLEGLHLPKFIIEGMNIDGVYYHPTFLYEFIGNIIVFLIIVFVIKRFIKVDGVAFASYFIGYGIVRFFVESLRTDSLMLIIFNSLRAAQVTSILFVILGIGIVLYAYYLNKNKKDNQIIDETTKAGE